MILESLIVFVFLLLIACGPGVRIARRLNIFYSSWVECLAFTIGMGVACFIGVGFVLGVLGWLSRTSVIISLSVLALISIPALRKLNEIISEAQQHVRTRIQLIEYAALFFLFALTAVNLLGALAPDTIWDAHSYHLYLPKQWLAAGQMVHIPYNVYSAWPLNLSVIYALEMSLIDGSLLPQLTHFSLGILSTLLIYSYVRPRYGGVAASFASLIFYSIPVMAWLSGTAISDLGVSYFALFSVVGFLHWSESEEPGWLYLAAGGAGLVMGAKLTGLFALALLVTSIFYRGLLRREPARRMVYQASLVSLIAITLALPWYLKSYIQTGNPIFPFGYSLFGGKYWTEAINERYLASQYGYMGIGRSMMDYLLLPLRLLIPNPFPYEGSISWVLLIAPIWGLAQHKDKVAQYLSLYAILSFIFWSLFTTQQVRMLLPALGALSIVAGIGIASVTQGLRFRSWILSLLLVALLVEGIWGVWRERSHILSDQLAVAVGAMSRDDYSREHFVLADVFNFANARLPLNGAILAYNEVRGYLSQHEFIWGIPGGQVYVDYDQLKTEDALRRRLDELNVKYILVKDAKARAAPPAEFDSIKADLQMIYQQNGIQLYRLVSGSGATNRACYVTSALAYECPGNVSPEVPVGELVKGTKVIQTFVSQCSGFNRVELYFGAYGRVNTHPVILRVTDTVTKDTFYEQVIPGPEIADNQWLELAFEPRPDSMGKQYRISVHSPESQPGDAVTLWRSQGDVYPDGEALINRQPIHADLAFRYGCAR